MSSRGEWVGVGGRDERGLIIRRIENGSHDLHKGG